MLKVYATEQVRNVAILGHGSTGKSTLLDAILCAGGKIEKIGSAKDGTLASDFDDDEKARHMSIRSAMGFIEVDNVKINVIDTPGMADFVGEARAALQVAEAAILVVDSVDAVQIETEKAWRYLTEHKVPTIIFINKMDKERADFNATVEKIQNMLEANLLPVSIPMGAGEKFRGVADLLQMKALTPKGDGKTETPSAIPDDVLTDAELERSKMIELAAEGDDALIEKFLEGNELTNDEINRGIKNLLAVARGVPVVCGSSAGGAGIKTLIEVLKNFAPAPVLGKVYKGFKPEDKTAGISVECLPDKPFSGVVWKTYIDQYAGRFTYLKVISGQLLPEMEVFNPDRKHRERISKVYCITGNRHEEVPKVSCGDIGVVLKLEKTSTKDTLCDNKNAVQLPLINLPNSVFTFAIQAANKADSDKLGQLFNRIMDENPTIHYGFNAETKQTVLSGMGEMQLDIILKSIKEHNKIDVVTGIPRVAYRETITKKAEAQYKHKKQSGGHGQYGEVFLRVAPKKRGEGFEFIDAIVGGVIPRGYIPGVEKGVIEGMEEGPLGKFPVVDLSAELYYGSYHTVDSSEMAFKIAGRNALKNAVEAAGPHLLEPVMEVEVYVDKEYMGDVLNDITSRRGRVLGMSGDEGSESGTPSIKATVPLSEMLRYSIDLRSMTSGKATFDMKFSHYDPISGKIAEKVIEDRKKQLEEEAK